MNPVLQGFIPQRLLSSFLGWMGHVRRPRWLVHRFLVWFARRYGVNLEEAEHPIGHYESFTSFFTRRLKPGLRRFPDTPQAIGSPADGTVAASGVVTEGRAIQAKGIDYRLEDLLCDRELAGAFEGGTYRTIYLSPKDYHRVHAPCSGVLRRRIHGGGRLFSVSASTVAQVPNIFAGNERVILEFDSGSNGRWMIVFVGALVVGGIETVWEGTVNPLRKGMKSDRVFDGMIRVSRGDEIGLFRAGSTVICFWQKGRVRLEPFGDNAPVKLGETIGEQEGN